MGHVSNIMPPKEQQIENSNVSSTWKIEYMIFLLKLEVVKLTFVNDFRKKTVVLIS